MQDMKKEKHPKNGVVFYGGEPLLNQEFIKDVIRKTKFGKLEYLSFTNGTMLDNIDPFLLKKLDALFISIDGEHRVHDKFRGPGTFEKIIQNMFAVKNRFEGKTIARLCHIPGNSIYSSVLGVVNWFDNVHWQIENSPSTITNPKDCLSSYSDDLDLLIGYWTNHLHEGIVKKIIPFQAIVSSLLFEKENHSFRCGAGSKTVAIDTGGECFICDDLIGREKFHIGSVQQGINHEKLRACGKNIFCNGCKIRKICGGRCLRAWQEFPKKMQFYCSTTKMLANKLKEKIPEIKELIKEGIISKQELDNSLAEFTEAIP